MGGEAYAVANAAGAAVMGLEREEKFFPWDPLPLVLYPWGLWAAGAYYAAAATTGAMLFGAAATAPTAPEPEAASAEPAAAPEASPAAAPAGAPAASLERRHPARHTRHLSKAEVDELKALRAVLRETSELLDRKGY